MSEECELLNQCGFFRKYQAAKDLACRGFIRRYCKGPKMNECKRKQFRAKHGVMPHDDMLPSGQNIVPPACVRDSGVPQSPAAPLSELTGRT